MFFTLLGIRGMCFGYVLLVQSSYQGVDEHLSSAQKFGLRSISCCSNSLPVGSANSWDGHAVADSALHCTAGLIPSTCRLANSALASSLHAQVRRLITLASRWQGSSSLMGVLRAEKEAYAGLDPNWNKITTLKDKSANPFVRIAHQIRTPATT